MADYLKWKLAVVSTHPIQYQVPLWRAISESGGIGIKVFYATRHGVDESEDPGFGRAFAWDIPMLEGYDHEFVPSMRIPGFPGPASNSFPRGLRQRLSRGEFDAVFVNGYTSAASIAGLLAAWRLRLRILMQGDSHEHGRASTWKSSPKQWLLPRILQRVDGFLAVGSWNEEYWRSYGVPAGKIAKALFAVDNERFSAKASASEAMALALRSGWGAAEREPVFLYAAKLTSGKAPDLLIRAFSALRSSDAHLVFVGSGPLEAALKNLVRSLGLKRVHWEGFVNQSDLPAYYRAADVLVLPSRFEPWGLVVNEAMACRTPCIVSDVVGAGADLIEGQDSGMLFRHDDMTSLVDALRAASDPEVRTRWQQNLPRCLETASLAKTVDALESLLSRVAGRGPMFPVPGGPKSAVTDQ